MALPMATRSDGVKFLRTSFSANSPARMLDTRTMRAAMDGPLENIPDGQQAPLTEDQEVVFSDADRLEQAFLGDAGSQCVEIAHVFPVPLADEDCAAGDVRDGVVVVHWTPPVAGMQPNSTNTGRICQRSW